MSVRADQQSQMAPASNPNGLDAIATINAAQAADSPLDTANDFNTIARRRQPNQRPSLPPSRPP